MGHYEVTRREEKRNDLFDSERVILVPPAQNINAYNISSP